VPIFVPTLLQNGRPVHSNSAQSFPGFIPEQVRDGCGESFSEEAPACLDRLLGYGSGRAAQNGFLHFLAIPVGKIGPAWVEVTESRNP
jgi:hypothetical protein